MNDNCDDDNLWSSIYGMILFKKQEWLTKNEFLCKLHKFPSESQFPNEKCIWNDMVWLWKKKLKVEPNQNQKKKEMMTIRKKRKNSSGSENRCDMILSILLSIFTFSFNSSYDFPFGLQIFFSSNECIQYFCIEIIFHFFFAVSLWFNEMVMIFISIIFLFGSM